MLNRKVVLRGDLDVLNHYKIDNGKYVGMKLGDYFDEIAVNEQDLVKPFLKKIEERLTIIAERCKHTDDCMSALEEIDILIRHVLLDDYCSFEGEEDGNDKI